MRKRAVSRGPFCFCLPEEWNMTQTVTLTVKTPQPTPTAPVAPTIALRLIADGTADDYLWDGWDDGTETLLALT
jgi:hypothetical protein